MVDPEQNPTGPGRPKNHQSRNRGRHLYVFERMSCIAIANELGFAADTVRRWRKDAKTQGDDWDTARTANVIAGDGLEQTTTHLAMTIIQLLEQCLPDLKDGDEIDVETRVELLIKATDALSKATASARRASPKVSELGVAQDVLVRLAEYIKVEHPGQAEVFMQVLEPFGQTLVEAYR